jgi:hypothetical protein
MRTIYFLTPSLEIKSGGYLASVNMASILGCHCPIVIATYKKRISGIPYLDDILKNNADNNAIFLIFWGHDLKDLLLRLKGKNIVYHSHSTGHGLELPEAVPIIAVSQHTLAYWGRFAPNNPLFLMPNLVDFNESKPLSTLRDIDVLVQARKSSSYLMKQLVPELQKHCQVKILTSWVDDINAYYDRSKIYLYDSSQFWIQHGLSEGFGLPPLEAISRGCIVFSSLNDALASYLDPEINCKQLRCFSTSYDRDRILSTLKHWQGPVSYSATLAPYTKACLVQRANSILLAINAFFDACPTYDNDIPTYRRKKFIYRIIFRLLPFLRGEK